MKLCMTKSSGMLSLVLFSLRVHVHHEITIYLDTIYIYSLSLWWRRSVLMTELLKHDVASYVVVMFPAT